MVDHATREEMLAAFGPFAVVFEPLGDDRTPYLSLLHLHDEGTVTVIQHIRVAASTPDAESSVVTMLRDVNWRPHLVGAIATYFRRSDRVLAQMWRAVDAGSWVTPQLTAVLSLIDDGFFDHSLERLVSYCPLSNDPEYTVDMSIARHSAQGPAGSHQRSSKAASSLGALLRRDFPDDERVKLLQNDGELQQLIADDVDDGGGIATSWRTRLVELAAAT